MTAVYNENDEFAAQWLRNLIAGGMIAPGDVDERSIEDVLPVEYAAYTQVHLFAGIGVWSYSMRSAGWPDDCHGWSCSCPCQPFSQAGEGKGLADERHLWPAAYHLVTQCGPDVVLGEQVASPDGFAWFDVVQNDMEAAAYTIGAVVTPSAGYGAPHIRHRTYWVAYRDDARSQGRQQRRDGGQQRLAGPGGMVGWLGNAPSDGRKSGLPPTEWFKLANAGADSWLGDTASGGRGEQRGAPFPWSIRHIDSASNAPGARGPGPVNGFWNDVDWLRCKDARWRPVESSTFPLVNGAANRVGLLRGYGNAIVAPQAAEFIRVAMEYAP